MTENPKEDEISQANKKLHQRLNFITFVILNQDNK